MNPDRYLRQKNLETIGSQGQKKLAASSVLIVGVGGLGSPAALYLAGAGVGKLGLVDGDSVSLTNLHRQILFQTNDVGSLKVEIAKKRLKDLNPEIEIRIHPEFLTPENAVTLFSDYDLILDGTDQFETKFLINDTAFKTGKPVVHGSVNGFEGQAALFDGRTDACFRCYQSELPRANIQNCAQAGVLGPVAGIVGTLQATLALQFLLSLEPELGVLKVLDLQSGCEFSSFKIRKNPECPTCSHSFAANSTSNSSIRPTQEMTAELLRDQIQKRTPIQIIDVRDYDEWNSGHIEQAIHWPLEKIEKGDYPELNPDQLTVFYCHRGYRSKRAIDLLASFDHGNLVHLRAGIQSWKYPLA